MMDEKFFTIHKYIKDVKVDIAKGRSFPDLRGTYLPSFDIQIDGGVAINWIGIRVRMIGYQMFTHSIIKTYDDNHSTVKYSWERDKEKIFLKEVYKHFKRLRS